MEIIISLIAGAFLTLFIFPLVSDPIQDWVHKIIVGLLGSGQPRRKGDIAGNWHERWNEDGKQITPQAVDYSAHIKQFGSRISGSFTSDGEKYFFIGRVLNHYVTGTWQGELGENSYYGAFQLRLYPGLKTMDGKWIGYSKQGSVKSGNWEWKRPEEKKYESQKRGANKTVDTTP